jgi:xylulokinase
VLVTVVAGVDCSTQSTKVVVVDLDDGTVVASGRAPHVVVADGDRSESDPSTWLTAFSAAMPDMAVDALAIAGQQHGLVVCDERGEPLRPAVLWNDTRSSADAAGLVEHFGAGWWADRVGSVPVPSFTVTSWAWLRRTEPSVAAAAGRVRLPHDWVTERLTGAAVTDRGDASGTGWWSEAGYVAEVLDHVELDAAVLPRVAGPTEAVGEWRGALVGPGTGDNMAAALGLGLAPGQPVMSLGTSGTVFVVSDARPRDATGVVAGFADATGRYLPLACTLNATLAVDRIAGWLGRDRDDVAATSEDVVVIPFLDGERTPNLPDATGTIVGLTSATDAGAILRSAYEGVIVSLLDALERIDDGDAPLTLIGGGARGQVWRDVVRALSGRAVVVPEADELVALGAAAQAAALLTGEAPDAVARRWGVARGEVLEPMPRDDAALARHRAARDQLAMR